MKPWASERRAKIDVVRALTTVAGPLLVLATMALGLRMGAEPAGIAAVVMTAPAPAARDRLAWQLRVLLEERRIREPAANVKVEVRARRAAGTKSEASWAGVTNPEGVAEAELTLADVAPGDTVDLEVRSVKDGTVLARGPAVVPPIPARAETISGGARPTRIEGPLLVSVYPPPGGIAPQFDSVVWVTVYDAFGSALSGARLSVELDPGLELRRAPAPTCAAGATSLVVQGIGHVFGLRVTATEAAARPRTGSWYGALPVVPGGDEITIDPPQPAEGSPSALRVRAASAKPLVYVEILDDVGREFATSAAITTMAGFGIAEVTLPPLPRGKHFAVVSSRADGFHLGTSVARAFRVGPAVASSCEADFQLATREPPSFERTVAIDGFVLRREEAARIRRKGMLLAVGALVTGGILAALMLATSLRRSMPRFDLEPNELEAMTKSTTPRWLVVALLAGLSCLVYFLLAALVLYSGS